MDGLEEEMLSKIPKFKAHPLNKKVSMQHKLLQASFHFFSFHLNFQTCSHPFRNLQILEAPLLTPLHKTIPQLPKFQVQFGHQTH